MKKFLLISGIILLVIGIVCLLLAGLNYFAYMTALDATTNFYHTKYRLTIIFLVVGLILLVIAIVLLILKNR